MPMFFLSHGKRSDFFLSFDYAKDKSKFSSYFATRDQNEVKFFLSFDYAKDKSKFSSYFAFRWQIIILILSLQHTSWKFTTIYFLTRVVYMVDKKGKNRKQINTHEKDDQKNAESKVKKSALSDIFLDDLKWAFNNFNKISESHRAELYGNQEFLEQFWEYFKKEHPNLLDKIDKKDLPVYIQALENKWFSIWHITNKTTKLHEEFKDEDTETHVVEKSLSELKKFCEDKTNNMPDGVFKKFADATWFSHDRIVLSSDGKIRTLDDLPLLWKKFLEKEGIKLGETSAQHAERILTPNYNPTERVMVTVALTKIRRELKWSLKTAFDQQFPLPVDIFSPYQDLINFKTEWMRFLDDHASEIDKPLAKKLDEVIVTNADIYKELLKWWRKFDDTKWFSEREQYFRRVFNKLATRQLFEEVQKTQDTIDHYVTEMGNTFKQFPPYVNDVLSIYPFNDKIISGIDTSFHSDLDHIDTQFIDLNSQYAAATDEEKKTLRIKMKALKQQREQRRWQAYIAFLRTKDAALADVFAQLVGSKFDFSVLSPDQQQLILNVLVKNRLEDSIKNKIPELLSVKEEELTQFVHDLFDLKKMDLVIPTKYGPVPLKFLKKEFVATARKQFPTINNLEDLKNLPLNFVTQLTESNATFFEDSPIFYSLYTDFAAKNGKFRCNEGYKVRIKKDGKMVEWYLSPYCPINEKYNDKEYLGTDLFLYSQPITAPHQERELVTRPHEEWKWSIPVVIKATEESEYDMEILDKQLNLNGDAFGALLFGYVLGQQSINTSMSPEKEKELAEKIGTLDVYKEKEEWEEEEPEPVVEAPEKSKEDSEQKKFEKERKNLKWYWFPEEKYKDNLGFVKWSKLFIPFADSEVPPVEMGKAWIQMEIMDINLAKWTFKVKFRGGELSLGKSEWISKELPITPDSLKGIKDAFGDKIYKLPDTSKVSFDQQLDMLTTWSLATGLDKHFGSLKFDSSKLTYTLWDYKGEEVTHFGIYEPKAMGEAVDTQTGKLILYKIHPNTNGTITVSGDSTAGNYAKHFPARDMDYATFMLFVEEKWLQPKCKKQMQAITTKVAEDQETPTTVRKFSIGNVMSFFTNGVSKIKDGLKKYDDERAEDLNDVLTSQGQLWSKIWWFLSPFSRVSSSFETMGMEQFLERDNRIWKKVEKRTKIYEDFDYSKFYGDVIEPMLSWKIKIVPHYKMAAILLVHLKKGKWPYAKNPSSTAEGRRIGKLLGNDHQARYLAIREKRIRDLEENAHIYGDHRADQTKNELVELEMRYIVHVMDGRHMWINTDNDKTKLHFQAKYSKKFVDELEWAYKWFFTQNTVDEWFTKNKDVNFEFATVEYFRLLADRPQQALPFLKVMATKAINDKQWHVFETAVLAGMLSGIFLTMIYSDTQSYIQSICRTRWFIPWIFAKDIKQQHKIQRLLDMFSGGEFTKKMNYAPEKLSFRKNTWAKKFIWDFVARTDSTSEKWKWKGKTVRTNLSKFFELTWGNVDDKTLLDLYSNPDLSMSDKLLLEEFIDNSNEKDEELDPEVRKNLSSLTWSVLTKSQSVVAQMIKFDNWGFAGKDGDEIQNMRAFSEKMQEAIPKWKLDSHEQTKFFVKKFFNRFGEKWFAWNNMTEFLKRLKWCNNQKWSMEQDDVLYYSIVGEIINHSASNNANPPIELLWALWAWKDFFKDNLDTILQPDVITSCFGGAQYKYDYDKSQATLEPRETSWFILDREESSVYMYGLPKEERALVTQKKRDLGNENKYLNKKLYTLAEDLGRKCWWFPNRFRQDVHQQKKDLVKKNPNQKNTKATGAKIKNTQVIEQVRQILEGKQPEEIDNGYIPENPYDDYYEY